MASARVRLTAVVPGRGYRYKDQGLGSSPIGSSRYVSAVGYVARVSQGQEGASVPGSSRGGGGALHLPPDRARHDSPFLRELREFSRRLGRRYARLTAHGLAVHVTLQLC